MSCGARLKNNKNSSLTKNNRGRPRKHDKRDIRISFRVTWAEYKRLLERSGGKRRLNSFIRRKLEVE